MASIRRLIGFTSVLFLLSACGGGSSGDGDSGTQPPPPTTPTYSVTTAVAGNGTGSISPTSRSVTQGSTTSFTVSPGSDSTIASVSGCGGSLSGTTYTTGAISSNCTVTATFDLKVYTVTATAGSGGSITPSSRSVTHGETATFSVTPNSGQEIESVAGCGGNLSGNTYTTGSITVACSVVASFRETNTTPPPQTSFTVSTATTGTGSGTITPGSATVNEGQTASFTVVPDTGSEIESVLGCSGSLAGNTYTTGAINSSCTVTASFRTVTAPPPGSYAVTTTTSGNGSGNITPSSATVNAGQTASFEVVADHGSKITSVTGCDGSLDGNNYTTGPINSDCMVTAHITLITYTITVTAGEGGSVSPDSVVVDHGADVTLTATPDAAYSFVDWTEAGRTVSTSSSYTFSAVGDRILVANFELDVLSLAVGGTATGLSEQGADIYLSLNGDERIRLTSDGTFSFMGLLPEGSNYTVVIDGGSGSFPYDDGQAQCLLLNAEGLVDEDTASTLNLRCVPAIQLGSIFSSDGLALSWNSVGADNYDLFALPVGVSDTRNYSTYPDAELIVNAVSPLLAQHQLILGSRTFIVEARFSDGHVFQSSPREDMNATPLGGIIDESKILTRENSPYRHYAFVQIAHGVTVEMEPGVHYVGSVYETDYWAREVTVFGTLKVVGTQDEVIELENVWFMGALQGTEEQPHAAELEIDHAAGSGVHTGHHFQRLHVQNSLFTQAQIGFTAPTYTQAPRGENALLIIGNTFLEFGGMNIRECDGEIRNNLFDGAVTSPIIELWPGLTKNLRVHQNSFLNTNNRVVLLSTNTGDLDAIENYWGTTDIEVIKSYIYDRSVDLRINGTVHFEPYLIAPHPDTPIFP